MRLLADELPLRLVQARLSDRFLSLETARENIARHDLVICKSAVRGCAGGCVFECEAAEALGRRNSAGHLVMLAEIELGLIPESVEPDTLADITVTNAHRDEAHMGRFCAG